MKVLSAEQILMVSGGGFIETTFANIGGLIGNTIYGMAIDAAGGLSVKLPIVGTLGVMDILPDLGKQLGSALGGSIGGMAESFLGGIPLIGGWLSNLLGN